MRGPSGSTSDIRSMAGKPLTDDQIEKLLETAETPAYLTAEAGKVYRTTVGLMCRMGVYSEADETLIAQYSSLTAEFMRDPDEFHPAKHVQLRLQAEQLGLTPLGRQKLRVSTQKKTSKRDQLKGAVA